MVDDERTITDAIYYLLLRQEEWDIEVLRAYDGDAAWQLLEKSRFDLIISDICMPGLDGLTLADKMRALWPDCRIIFLTGYQNFEHAYRALQLGQVRYILKTSDFSSLLHEVDQMLSSIHEQRAESRRQTLLEAQVAMAFSMLRHDLCAQLLRGKSPLPSQVGADSAIPLDVTRELLILLMRAGGGMNDHSIKLLLYTIHKRLADHRIRWVHFMYNNDLICLLQPESLEPQAMLSAQSLVWEAIDEGQTLIEQETGMAPTLLLSNEPVAVPCLPEQFAQMQQLSAQLSLQGNGAIMRVSAQQPSLDAQGAIRHTMQYIYQNYGQDLSLLSLADSVHMSADYFSRLFKKEVGRNFTDFLNGVRIEAACRLLRDTYMKVSDIAVATGFGSSKYFHVVFKRYTDVTPNQWREANRA